MKRIKAPLTTVYRAWIEPEQMKHWFGCEECRKVTVKQDFREGGQYRVDMHLEGDVIVTVFGVFKTIEEERKLVYTWSNNFPEFPAEDTLVTVTFTDLGGETEIVLKHENFALADSAIGHEKGWAFAMDTLTKMMETI